MKGPFAVNKEYPNWGEDGEYSPVIKTVPSTSHVSIWNFYPDPDAANMDEAEYIVERHKMSRSQLRALKGRPFFRDNTIDIALNLGESYDKSGGNRRWKTISKAVKQSVMKCLSSGVLLIKIF